MQLLMKTITAASRFTTEAPDPGTETPDPGPRNPDPDPGTRGKHPCRTRAPPGQFTGANAAAGRGC